MRVGQGEGRSWPWMGKGQLCQLLSLGGALGALGKGWQRWRGGGTTC